MDALWMDHQQRRPTGVVGTDVGTRGGAGEGHDQGAGKGCRRDKVWPRQAASTTAEKPQSVAAAEAYLAEAGTGVPTSDGAREERRRDRRGTSTRRPQRPRGQGVAMFK